MGEKPAGDPHERPFAGEFRAGLGQKQEHDPDDGDREPCHQQSAQLFGKADAALRLMELQRREHDERHDQDGEQGGHVARLEVPAVEFRVIGDDADRDDEYGIGELERRLEQRRMLLEQVAAHVRSLSDLLSRMRRRRSGRSSRREPEDIPGVWRGRATQKCARIGPSLRVAAKKRVRVVARLADIPDIGFASRLASIAFWPGNAYVKASLTGSQP